MPITPFHFGPGFLTKAVLPKYFSFRIFVLTNVVIDLEPIYFVLTNQYPLHRFFHTYLGATVVAVGSIFVGRPICYYLTGIWNRIFKSFKILNKKITAPALIIAAFIGTYSHIFLDSIMHRDLYPFSPWSKSNALLHTLSYGQLHLFCIMTGIIGIVIYVVRKKDQNV